MTATTRRNRTKKKRVPEREDPDWIEYKETGSVESRNRLIERYLPLVEKTAERMSRKLPANVEADHLTNAGVFGLMDAIDGFDLEREVRFETYCAFRTRGAILDELRANDWVPRLVRARANKVRRGSQAIEKRIGREPTDEELAEELDVDMDELEKIVKGSRAVTLTSLDEGLPETGDGDKSLRRVDVLEDDEVEDPSRRAARRDMFEVACEELEERDQTILCLYYVDDLTLREIGVILDLSESRVCQLHGRIIRQLRESMEDQEEALCQQ